MWSWDCVADRTDNGGTLRILTLIDEYSRMMSSVRNEIE